MKTFSSEDRVRIRRAGVTDIAREAGVSIATVSRAMNQPALVQPATLTRIREVATRLGYVPNRKAQALASGRSRIVGIVIPTLNSAIFASALQTMQRTLYGEGYQLLVTSNEYDPSSEAAAVSQLISHGVDGLIVVGGARPRATLRMIEEAGLPLVQTWCGSAEHDCIGVDNHRAGTLVARHLLDLGHRRFGVLCGHVLSNDRQKARLDGVRAELAREGILLDAAQIVESQLSIGAGRGAARSLMQVSPRPTALIGLLDVLAIGAMIELQEAGFPVPAAASVAGIDNVEFAAHLAPALTTVNIPSADIGAEAARRIIARLEGDEDAGTPVHVALPVALIVRQSTGPAPATSGGGHAEG